MTHIGLKLLRGKLTRFVQYLAAKCCKLSMLARPRYQDYVQNYHRYDTGCGKLSRRIFIRPGIRGCWLHTTNWESEWFEHRLFKGPDTDINLHVFSVGTSEIDRMLRFRDWLRSNKTDRDKYAQVKRNLAKKKWRHIQHYADAKTSIIQEIMERANANRESS